MHELLASASPKQPALVGSEVGFVFVLIALAVGSGRLLGIRVTWLRGILAAFIGTIAGSVIYYGQSSQSSSTPDFALAFAVPALLATMLVLAAAEIAYRPGSVQVVPSGLARVPHPINDSRAWFGRSARYVQVLWVVARNGLNPYLRGQVVPTARSEATSITAIRLRRTLEECGGVFVKLGQLLSTRPDLLPQSFIEELTSLQDSAPPIPYVDVEPVLRTALGASPKDVFAEFDERPLAAASIAQVHRARLKSGEAVVVKIRRPRIATLIKRDLDIIQRLARAFASRSSWPGRDSIVRLADGFAAAVWEETDFRIEAGNINAVAEAGSPEGVRVPRIWSEYSSATVLVMEWLDGVKVRDGTQVLNDLQLDRDDVARRLLRCVLRQIMVEGIYHADPHPGNVLILRDGTPALIDFGSVGRLSASQQSALRHMLIGIDRRDAAAMSDALSELGDIRDPRKQDLLEHALGELLASRLSRGMQPGAELFTDVLRLFVEFQVALPGHVAAVFRCLVTLDGTLRVLSPGFSAVDESRAAAGEIAHEALGVRSLGEAVRDELMTQLPILRRLPRKLDRLSGSIEDGHLAIRVSLFDTPEDRQFVAAMVSRMTLAFIAASLGVVSVMLESAGGGPQIAPGLSMFHALGYFGLLASAVLIMRVIVAIARDRAA